MYVPAHKDVRGQCAAPLGTRHDSQKYSGDIFYSKISSEKTFEKFALLARLSRAHGKILKRSIAVTFIIFNDNCALDESCHGYKERWGAGVEYHFQEI